MLVEDEQMGDVDEEGDLEAAAEVDVGGRTDDPPRSTATRSPSE